MQQPLAQILSSQGFGARRTCEGLVAAGRVSIGGTVCDDPFLPVEAEGLVMTVEGREWPVHAKAYVLLHKPAGHECSQKPSVWPSVYTLLPSPLRLRPVRGGQDGVQCVGRLDQDTTGMLLLSDDGAFLHRMASPKHHVPKVYEATTKHPVDEDACRRLLAGVVLDDDPRPVRAAACEPMGSHGLRLTLTEGKYHQVKRMLFV